MSLPQPTHFAMDFGTGDCDTIGVGAGIGAGVGSAVATGADCTGGAASTGADPAVGLPQNGQKFNPSGTSLPHPVQCLVP